MYEFGASEYCICSSLDGEQTFEGLNKKLKRDFGTQLSPAHFHAFVEKLKHLGLLKSEGPKPWELQALTHKRKIADIDPFMRWCAGLLRPCFTSFFLGTLACFLFLAVFLIIKNGWIFIAEVQMIRNVYGLHLLLLVPVFGFLIILPLGEMAKGIACRYHGGHVSGLNLQFHYHFVPHLSVDIVDSLWFLGKKKRMYVLMSGITCNVVLFVLSTFGWLMTASWTMGHLFFTLLEIATFLFLFFNSFPWLPRDGYHLLVNHLEIEDLSERSRRSFLARLFLEPATEPLTKQERTLFFRFGFASVIFKILLMVLFLGLVGFVLTESLGGVGLILFLVILTFRFEYPLKLQWLKIPVMGRMLTCQRGAIRMRLIVKVFLLAVFVALMFVPYPFEVGGEFSIVPARQQGIRAEASGTIEEVFVAENQFVKSGQAIGRIDDQGYRINIDIIKANIKENEALLELRLSGAKPEEIAAAEQHVEMARKNLEYSTQEEKRFARMLKEKAIPETEYNRIKHQREIDREALKTAESNLEVVKSVARDEEVQVLEARRQRLESELLQAEVALEHTILYSPMDGKIITPDLDQRLGQRLERGDLLAVVESSDTVIAEIEIYEEDIGEIEIGAQVKLRSWSDPLKTLYGEVVAVAPIAREKDRDPLYRTLTEKEQLIGQREQIRQEGRVIMVMTAFSEDIDNLKTDMTGYAKIECHTRPAGIAFSRWLARFFFVEVWSWIP